MDSDETATRVAAPHERLVGQAQTHGLLVHHQGHMAQSGRGHTHWNSHVPASCQHNIGPEPTDDLAGLQDT